MKAFITCLLLVALLGIVFAVSFAQQNQNTQKPTPEVETLKIQLQTVENEKIELTTKLRDAEAKLAEANTKLINAEFGKLERELRDSNQKWLIGWIIFFLTVLAVVGTPLWLLLKSGVNRIITNLKSNADQLIADNVEKSLDGFKEAVARVNILQDQIRILEKEHAASVLEGSVHLYDSQGQMYSEMIRALSNNALLDLFVDKSRSIDFKYKAAEVLTVRQYPKLVSPLLEFLNLVVDSKVDHDSDLDPEHRLRCLVRFLGRMHTRESYEGLDQFLNRLLTDNPKHKNLFLAWTVFSLVDVSGELNKADSLSILKRAISSLKVFPHEDQALINLAEHFDTFNEPDGIKDILTNGLTEMMPEVETQCLELLQKYDSEFVKEWQAQKESTNTQNEESE